MVAIDVLTLLVRGSGSLVLEVTESFSDQEWTTCALPGTNPPGFTAWHMARTVDWAVQTGVRGQPEVITDPRFQSLDGFGIGIGSSAEQAMAIARRMPRAAVGEYAASITAAALEWLALADEELLATPNQLQTNQSAYEAYRADGHLSEVTDLFGLPAWQLIARPAGSHIRVHYGELEVLAQAMRGSS
jgi:hypothetical protein